MGWRLRLPNGCHSASGHWSPRAGGVCRDVERPLPIAGDEHAASCAHSDSGPPAFCGAGRCSLPRRIRDLAPVAHVPDGKHAIDYLQGTGIYSDRIRYPLPSLLITDLKMPNRTGFDLLAWIKTQAQFSQLPTIVLTSSAVESDKQRALELGASSYLVKPSHLEDLVLLARGLQEDFLHQQA